MSEIKSSEPLVQYLGDFAFHVIKEAGLKIAIEDNVIAKNMGGFFSSDAPYTEAPRYLAFTLDWDDPALTERVANKIERNINNFIKNINKSYGDLFDAGFEYDYKERLKTVYVKIEPLLENPKLLFLINGMLSRRQFMESSLTSLAGVTIYLHSDKLENKAIRGIGKGVGITSVVIGGAGTIKRIFFEPRMQNPEDIRETIRMRLAEDRSPDR